MIKIFKKNQLQTKIIDRVRYIQSLLGAELYIQIKIRQISNGAYIEYESDCNTYYKQLPLEDLSIFAC